MKTFEEFKKAVVAAADLSEKWSKEFMEKNPSGPSWYEYNSSSKLRKACEQTAQEQGFSIYDAQAIYVMLSEGWNDILDWATGHDVAMQTAIDRAKKDVEQGRKEKAAWCEEEPRQREYCARVAKEFKLNQKDGDVIHYAVFQDHLCKEVAEG